MKKADFLSLVPSIPEDFDWEARDKELQPEYDARNKAAEVERQNRRLARMESSGCPQRLLVIDTVIETQALDRLRARVALGAGVIVLAGGVGTGKTTAAVKVLMEGRGVPWFSTAAAYARSSRYSKQEWTDARFGVLDDLGVEYLDTKGSFQTDLDELVTHFHAQMRTLVITTNLWKQDFRDRYGERVRSRILEGGEHSWIGIRCDDMRVKR